MGISPFKTGFQTSTVRDVLDVINHLLSSGFAGQRRGFCLFVDLARDQAKFNQALRIGHTHCYGCVTTFGMKWVSWHLGIR